MKKEAVNNPFELELIYNIYGPSGKEITNSSLEFELSWKTLAAGESFVDENGNRVNFASISNGKIKFFARLTTTAISITFQEEEREGKIRKNIKSCCFWRRRDFKNLSNFKLFPFNKRLERRRPNC